MKNVAQYLRNAERNSNQRTMNFNGPRTLGFVDDRKSFVSQPGMTMNATGGGGDVAPSQPYVIIISSASSAAVADFDVLGAYQQLFSGNINPTTGNLVVGSITVYSGIPDVTYRDLLTQSQTQPFTVGMTYLQCTNVNQQVNEVFTITTKDASGPLVKVPIVPAIDPYQQQLGINVVKNQYRIDGNTKLTFSQILPNAVLTVRFYPADNINPARALSGANTTRNYGNPGVIR